MNLYFGHGREISCGRLSGSSLAGERLPNHCGISHRIPIGANGLVGPALLPGLPCAGLTCHAIKLAPTQLAVGVATDSRPVARLVTGSGAATAQQIRASLLARRRRPCCA